MRNLLAFILPLGALASPTPSRNSTHLHQRSVGYGIQQCDDTQRAKVEKALTNAISMAKTAVDEWWEHGAHGEIAATYVGIPNDGKYKDNPDAQKFKANLARVADLAPGNWFTKYIGVYCTDVLKACNQNIEGTNRPKAGELIHNKGGWFGEVGAFEMCPLWFNGVETPEQKYTENKDWDEVSLAFLENDAGKLLHEFMHVDYISQDRGHIEDVKYGGQRAYTAPIIAQMVKDGWKASQMILNADTYTQFVNAIYFKNEFGRTLPPEAPASFIKNKQCFGKSYQYVTLDIAQTHVSEFCDTIASKYTPNTFGEWTQEWDKDTPEHVMFKFDWKRSGHLSSDQILEYCRTDMYELLNGCDTDSHTWKNGGATTHTVYNKNPNLNEEAYTFSIIPKHERPDLKLSKTPGKCDVYYKFFYDEFWIYGGLFEGKNHGQDKLLPNLRRCGVVSEWAFDYYPESDKDNFEWHAYGRIPIGAQQWDCVRQAVVDAGGPSDLGCGGS